MTTKKIVWRLDMLPSPLEVKELAKESIITHEEAREILFRSETQEDRDKKGLESEIKFLRDLVERLSKSKTEVVQIIKEVAKPYWNYPWYQPYNVWCTTTTGNNTSDMTIAGALNSLNIGATSGATYSASMVNQTVAMPNVATGFSAIKTF